MMGMAAINRKYQGGMTESLCTKSAGAIMTQIKKAISMDHPSLPCSRSKIASKKSNDTIPHPMIALSEVLLRSLLSLFVSFIPDHEI
jgi:hypothetical protein